MKVPNPMPTQLSHRFSIAVVVFSLAGLSAAVTARVEGGPTASDMRAVRYHDETHSDSSARDEYLAALQKRFTETQAAIVAQQNGIKGSEARLSALQEQLNEVFRTIDRFSEGRQTWLDELASIKKVLSETQGVLHGFESINALVQSLIDRPLVAEVKSFLTRYLEESEEQGQVVSEQFNRLREMAKSVEDERLIQSVEMSLTYFGVTNAAPTEVQRSQRASLKKLLLLVSAEVDRGATTAAQLQAVRAQVANEKEAELAPLRARQIELTELIGSGLPQLVELGQKKEALKTQVDQEKVTLEGLNQAMALTQAAQVQLEASKAQAPAMRTWKVRVASEVN